MEISDIVNYADDNTLASTVKVVIAALKQDTKNVME